MNTLDTFIYFYVVYYTFCSIKLFYVLSLKHVLTFLLLYSMHSCFYLKEKYYLSEKLLESRAIKSIKKTIVAMFFMCSDLERRWQCSHKPNEK